MLGIERNFEGDFELGDFFGHRGVSVLRVVDGEVVGFLVEPEIGFIRVELDIFFGVVFLADLVAVF